MSTPATILIPYHLAYPNSRKRALLSATSPAPTSPTPPKSFFEGLSAASTILTIVIAAGGTLLTSGAIYGSFVNRLTNVEQGVTDNKTERDKALDEFKQNTVSKDRYEADFKAVERIEQTVKEIRRDQLEDLRRRADAATTSRRDR